MFGMSVCTFNPNQIVKILDSKRVNNVFSNQWGNWLLPVTRNIPGGDILWYFLVVI